MTKLYESPIKDQRANQLEVYNDERDGRILVVVSSGLKALTETLSYRESWLLAHRFRQNLPRLDQSSIGVGSVVVCLKNFNVRPGDLAEGMPYYACCGEVEQPIKASAQEIGEVIEVVGDLCAVKFIHCSLWIDRRNLKVWP